MTEQNPPAAHTPGRLEQYDGLDRQRMLRSVVSGEQIASTQFVYFGSALTNARRLIACWNALEGIPTETIEQYGVLVTKGQEDWQALVDAARALLEHVDVLSYPEQRANLADALAPFTIEEQS